MIIEKIQPLDAITYELAANYARGFVNERQPLMRRALSERLASGLARGNAYSGALTTHLLELIQDEISLRGSFIVESLKAAIEATGVKQSKILTISLTQAFDEIFTHSCASVLPAFTSFVPGVSANPVLVAQACSDISIQALMSTKTKCIADLQMFAMQRHTKRKQSFAEKKMRWLDRLVMAIIGAVLSHIADIIHALHLYHKMK